MCKSSLEERCFNQYCQAYHLNGTSQHIPQDEQDKLKCSQQKSQANTDKNSLDSDMGTNEDRELQEEKNDSGYPVQDGKGSKNLLPNLTGTQPPNQKSRIIKKKKSLTIWKHKM